MGTPYPTPHDWREGRRMRALDLKQQGWQQRDISAALGATKGAVSQWLALARHGGREALRARPGRGIKPKLAPEQIRLVPDFLWHGPEASGPVIASPRSSGRSSASRIARAKPPAC